MVQMKNDIRERAWKRLQNEIKMGNNMVDIKVGQIWECINNKKQIIMISMVVPELKGYMFNGFEVVDYISWDPHTFCCDWRLIKQRE